MRQCGIGHHDHVHLDLTINGANGNVSYWGRAPVVAPKLDTQVLWDRNSAWRQAVSWWNLVADRRGRAGAAGRVRPGDRRRLGQRRDPRRDHAVGHRHRQLGCCRTGRTAIRSTPAVGSWARGYDEIIAGDWDGDGRVDDMIIWDRDTGNYVVQSWSGYAAHVPRDGARGRAVTTQLIAGDLDGDGRRQRHRCSGTTTPATGSSTAGRTSGSTYRVTGHWSRGYDEVIVGDWSAGGDLDETILWDRQTGRWVLCSWANFRWRYVRQWLVEHRHRHRRAR